MIMTKIFLCIYIYIEREREVVVATAMYPLFFEWSCTPPGPPGCWKFLQDGMMLIKQPGCPIRRFDESTSFGQRQTRSVCCNCSLSHTVSSKTEIGPSGFCTTSFAYQFWLNSSLLHRPVCSFVDARPPKTNLCRKYVHLCSTLFKHV